MDAKSLTQRLAANLDVIRSMVEGLNEEQARWRPEPGKWSILEVINHLYDEEHLDFRARIRLLWEDPTKDWPGIDPAGWVTKREYQKRELGPSLQNFAKERRDSIAWLQGLGEGNWDAYREHPVAGKMSAGDLFASWVAHDFLHIRQLSRLHFQYVVHLSEPFSVDYAGDW